MVGFGFLPFLIDTHFDARGRIGRLISGLYQLKMPLGIGVDESTAMIKELELFTEKEECLLWILERRKVSKGKISISIMFLFII